MEQGGNHGLLKARDVSDGSIQGARSTHSLLSFSFYWSGWERRMKRVGEANRKRRRRGRGDGPEDEAKGFGSFPSRVLAGLLYSHGSFSKLRSSTHTPTHTSAPSPLGSGCWDQHVAVTHVSFNLPVQHVKHDTGNRGERCTLLGSLATRRAPPPPPHPTQHTHIYPHPQPSSTNHKGRVTGGRNSYTRQIVCKGKGIPSLLVICFTGTVTTNRLPTH